MKRTASKPRKQPSDKEMLDWLLGNETKYCQWDVFQSEYWRKDKNYSNPRLAIQAAMKEK